MKTLSIMGISIALVIAQSCSEDISNEVSTKTAIEANTTWTSESHSNDADPDYEVVFPQDEVLQINIKISEDNWNSMLNDLAENISSNSNLGGPGGGPGGGGAPVVDSDSDFTPIWANSTLIFNEKEWNNVGIRFKGNSSLSSVYQSNIDKFSFKLDFDEFEDEYPEIKNQRFYGFKQLNLNNNFGDYSVMHEKIAADLFREFGLVAAKTTYVALNVDYGAGSVYFGLYTLVEEVDNTVIKTQYESNDGNLYKPEGTGATFASGTYNTSDMYKKTNEDVNDYSDVEALYNIINSSTRTTDLALWKTNLEAIFDVEIFLKWLAVNTTIQNWDTYGKMNHNFYLYNNPANGKLNWIPWDNNEAFTDGKNGGALSIDLSEVNSYWPIINYIIAVDAYEAKYKAYLKDFTDTVFYSDKMDETYDYNYNLIKEYVIAEEANYTFTSSANFEKELAFLKTHVKTRNAVVKSYIN